MIAHLNIQDDTLSNYLLDFLDVFCGIIDTDKTFLVFDFFYQKLSGYDPEDSYKSFLSHIIPIIFKKDDYKNHLDILLRSSHKKFHKDIFNNFMEVFFDAFETPDNISETELLVKKAKHILISFFNSDFIDFSDIITQCALHVLCHISLKESKSSIHDSLYIINHLTVFVSQLPEDQQEDILDKLFNSNFIHYFKFGVSHDSDSSASEAIRKRNDFISRVDNRLRRPDSVSRD